jgi:hypothetical protein
MEQMSNQKGAGGGSFSLNDALIMNFFEMEGPF